MGRRLLWLALSLAACTAAPNEDVDASNDAIRGGSSAADGFEAVGLLVFPGGTTCNGTLIAGDLVLTSATCLTQRGTPTTFFTGDGKAAASVDEATAAMRRHEVAGAKVFPDYRPRRGFADMGIANPCRQPHLDIGLVKLRLPVAGVEPLALEARAPRAAEKCTIVGYGQDDDGNIGARRSGSVSYAGDRLDAFTFEDAPGRLGAHDYGAPLVCGEAVIGVGACRGDADFFARIDRTLAWIGRMRASWENDTCLAPRDVGALAGDRAGPPVLARGTCNEAVRVQVKEQESAFARIPLVVRATLTSPPGEDFDLFVYEDQSTLDPFATRGHGPCGLSTALSEEPSGDDVVTRSWGDESNMSVDDSRWLTFEVRSKKAGDGCAEAAWELRVEGKAQ